MIRVNMLTHGGYGERTLRLVRVYTGDACELSVRPPTRIGLLTLGFSSQESRPRCRLELHGVDVFSV